MKKMARDFYEFASYVNLKTIKKLVIHLTHHPTLMIN